MFDGLTAELEEAMFSLDGGQMLKVLDKMQGFQYCRTPLLEKLRPVRKKIEMSDYMSAVDAVSQIRNILKSEEAKEKGDAAWG